jgi:hypothetical protein
VLLNPAVHPDRDGCPSSEQGVAVSEVRMMVGIRRGVVYLALTAFFITDAVPAEVIGDK